MKGVTLRQRPAAACGFGPRPCRPGLARPGVRVGVIVPSRDNASSDKRVQMVYTYWDSPDNQKLELDEIRSAEPQAAAAATRDLDVGVAAAELQLRQQLQQQRIALPPHVTPHPEVSEAAQTGPAASSSEASGTDSDHELDLELLRERIASASLASTSSASSSSSVPISSPGADVLLARPVDLSVAMGGVASVGLNGFEARTPGSVLTYHQSNHAPSYSSHASTTATLTRETETAEGGAGHQATGGGGGSGSGHEGPGRDRSVALAGPSHPHADSLSVPPSPAASMDAPPAPAAPGSTVQPGEAQASIPGSIWILCAISAALTCASCVFNTALPIYMVSELKMSMRSMGMFEGVLEAFSYIVRMCSGIISDRMTSRKAAITLGFAAGAMAKFGMASAGTVGTLFAGKAIDRLANGIQAAPRDALIGDLSPAGVRSACFGLAQSLRKYGSAVGALAAFFLMKASNNNYQLIFYSAATVSLLATLAFVFFVPAHARESPATAPAAAAAAAAASPAGAQTAAKPAAAAAAGPLAGLKELIKTASAMGSDFYRMLGVISLYGMGHINESLLEARAMEVGFGKAEATLVVAALAAVTFLTAFPLGQLDDKYGAGTTFAVGIGALIAGDLVLLLSGPHPMALFAACAFLGVHWAVIQGPMLSIVSGLAPPSLRGTAFGIFYTVMAVTAVAANTMYGTIWHTFGANAAFATSAGLMTVVLLALGKLLPAAAKKAHAVAPPRPSAPAVPSVAPAAA
ncbi:hypothetical protein HYH03_017547 [Edaphochlamys debaryana]|uniref:Major facilitator superfamily (MFS) profile domain-containing protein n=1 Tax=Edaphochlamys debaryana TaxID=47281 RepID=A0A835XMB9_9CHLO|nr:hypothetical protein HYH03_017547 [Edaphochlamys debaryana]|eukprot:KAG2483605.1 hypothetical protein HYH03_017547 [Edaphochlamys debaryana]